LVLSGERRGLQGRTAAVVRKDIVWDFPIFERGVVMQQRLMRRGLMLGIAVLAASAVAAISASAASAAPAVHFSFGPNTNTGTITGASGALCPFDVTVSSVSSGTGTDFFDQSGNLYREIDNLTEVDTFSANGKSLTGVPYTFNLNFQVDSSGNVTGVIATGVTEKIPLPDGSLFVGAGYIDFGAHGFPDFLFIPDHGTIKNLAGFCAALAP
jgi:hypothetical protein